MPIFNNIKRFGTVMEKIHENVDMNWFYIMSGKRFYGNNNETYIELRRNVGGDLVNTFHWFPNNRGGELDIPDEYCYLAYAGQFQSYNNKIRY